MKLLSFLVAMSSPLFYLCDQTQYSDLIPYHKIEWRKGGIEPRGIIDTLTDLTDKLDFYIEQPIQRTLTMLINTLKLPKDIAFYYLEEFEDLLQKKTEELVLRILARQEDASKLGVDISECIWDSIDRISLLPKHILDVATKCVKDKVQEAEDIILGSINNVNASHATAKTLWKEMQDCKESGFVKKTVCIVTLTAKIKFALIQIPFKVMKASSSATRYVSTFYPSLAFCTIGQVANVGFQGGYIITDVTFCSVKKFPIVSKLFRNLDEKEKTGRNIDLECSSSGVTFYVFNVIWFIGLLFLCTMFLNKQ